MRSALHIVPCRITPAGTLLKNHPRIAPNSIYATNRDSTIPIPLLKESVRAIIAGS